MQENGERCEANSLNKYYGDKGALDCLKFGAGDIAIIEAKNLNGYFIFKNIKSDKSVLYNYNVEYLVDYNVNTSDFRVLCKNGSLADYTGFDVDKTCALSTTIDSEASLFLIYPDYYLYLS